MFLLIRRPLKEIFTQASLEILRIKGNFTLIFQGLTKNAWFITDPDCYDDTTDDDDDSTY